MKTNPLNSDSKQNLSPPCQGGKSTQAISSPGFTKLDQLGTAARHPSILRLGEGRGGPLAGAEPTASPRQHGRGLIADLLCASALCRFFPGRGGGRAQVQRSVAASPGTGAALHPGRPGQVDSGPSATVLLQCPGLSFPFSKMGRKSCLSCLSLLSVRRRKPLQAAASRFQQTQGNLKWETLPTLSRPFLLGNLRIGDRESAPWAQAFLGW